MNLPDFLINPSGKDAEKKLTEALEKYLLKVLLREAAVNSIEDPQYKLVAELISSGRTAVNIAAEIENADLDAVTEIVETVTELIEQSEAEIRTNEELYTRLGAQAKDKTMEATEGLSELGQKAFMYQAWVASREGWYRWLDGEHDTLVEYLLAQRGNLEEGETRYYHLTWIIDNLIPFMESQGVSMEDLLGLTAFPTKAYAIVPAAKHAWQLYANDKKRLKTELLELMGMVTDPTITVKEARERLSSKKKIGIPELEKIEDNGKVIVLPGPKGQQRFLLVMEVNNHIQSEILQRKLRNLVPGWDVETLDALSGGIVGLLNDPNKFNIF